MKKLITPIFTVIMFLLTLTGCNDTTAADAELQNQLIGVWVQVENGSDVFNDDGSFTVFQFTDKETRVHIVTDENVKSWFMNDYSITDGKYKAILENSVEFAKLKFENGNMFWISDDVTNEFRRLSDEEIYKYLIPVDAELPKD